MKEKTGGESEADWVKKLLSSSKRKHLPILITNAFTIMKSGRPFTDFEFLIKLDKAKGVEVNNAYLNRKQGLEFGLAIADLLQSNLAKDFKTALFFNTILEECNNVYHLEQVIIYVWYSKWGKVFTKFVGIDNVIRANADQLFEMILKKLDEAYHWKPPVIPLTGSEFEWNNWAVHESEVESDNEGPSIESVEDSDASPSPLASNSEDMDLEIEITESINEESSQIVGDSSDLPLIIAIVSEKKKITQKIKGVANQLMLSFHCILHRFQLSMKSSMEKNK